MTVVSRSRWALVLWASLWLAGASLAGAQESPPPVEPAAPEEPEAISMANFAIQANAAEDRLTSIENALSATEVLDDVNEALTEIQEKGSALQDELGSLATRRMMSSEINSLQTELSLQEARTTRQISKLSARTEELDELLEQNEIDIGVWTQAVKDSRYPTVPREVRERSIAILKRLRSARDGIERKQSELLSVQSRALDVLDAIDDGQQTVTTAQRVQAQSVFERQDSPLWRRAAATTEGAEGEEAERAGYDIRLSWPEVGEYVRQTGGTPLFHLAFVLALAWLFVRTRAVLAARLEKRHQKGRIPWEDRAIEAMRHPWAAALLVGVALIRVFYPDRAVDMIILTWVVSLPLWFVVFKEMVPPAFRKVLVGLGLLGTLHIVITLVSGHVIIERLFLLLELALATAGAGSAVRYLRLADLPRNVRQSVWFTATGLWSRVAAVTAAAGVIATVLGYTYFAQETAMVVTIGSIAATAWIALARIAEALVTTGIHVGRLDGLRMIRANRDITSKWLSRGLRLAAIVLFFVGLADQTTIWRPFGQKVADWLSADLGIGFVETGVSWLDLIAFFFILWGSWLLARFVAFVLQEEVLLRLHMQPGVPYAVKTFTRYVIIVIGFVAAMAVLGIPLDKVTIMLSALGVGIGFGLQGLVNNVVSGFVLLTERPVRVRDKVEIEGVLGNVSSIGIRASTIRTFDGAEVIVPNGDLISKQVVNYTLSARQQRVTIPVGVAYGTDPSEVLKILRKVAAEDKGVFEDPAPLALFRGFGDSSLDFELRIFMDPSDVLDVPSAVLVAIDTALREAGIEIPFPQRDLHLRGLPEGMSFADADADADAAKR
jgi:small-conductance mechanosensitive channel